MIRIPGMGLAKGMATTLIRFFGRKATIEHPEQRQEVSPHHRGPKWPYARATKAFCL